MKEAKVISVLDKNDNKIYYLSDDGKFFNQTTLTEIRKRLINN